MVNNFADTLKEIRKIKGLTLEEVAEGIGTHHTTVQRWETRKSEPKFREFLKLCKFYEIDPFELAGTTDINVDRFQIKPQQALDILQTLVTSNKELMPIPHKIPIDILQALENADEIDLRSIRNILELPISDSGKKAN